MPVFEFRLTCANKESCEKTQSMMPDFKNKTMPRDRSYDHVAIKKFSNWREAINESRNIRKKLGDHILDLSIAEK